MPINKENFTYVADAAAKSIKSNLTVGIFGNTKIDKSALSAMTDIIAKQHNTSMPAGTKTKPSSHTLCDHSDYTEIKAAGWQSTVIIDYIRSKVRGLEPVLCDKYILLPLKQAQWNTIAGKLKKGITDFSQSKYTKVGADLPAIFGYFTISSGQLCATDAKTAQLSASNIESVINKSLS